MVMNFYNEPFLVSTNERTRNLQIVSNNRGENIEQKLSEHSYSTCVLIIGLESSVEIKIYFRVRTGFKTEAKILNTIT